MSVASNTAMTRPYEPLGTLKPVAEAVWVVDGPVVRMALGLGLSVPFPTRMTVVRLPDGALWLHSPTALSESLGAALEALGPVRHLIAPNFIHYAGLPSWSAAYPEAKTWAAPGVRERAEKQGVRLRIDAALGDEPPPDWQGSLDQLLFAGSRVMREVVFFHPSSRTLILADLIENFEADRMRGPLRWLLRLAGNVHPDGKAPVDLRWTFLRGKAEARVSLARMLAWQPERVILSHGKWYEKDGVHELERAFRWVR